MNEKCFSASAMRKCGRSDIIGVIIWTLHRRHIKHVRLILLRNFRRPKIKYFCCRCALKISISMCWQLLVWASWTINWVTWSLMSSIMGCFWFQVIGARFSLPLARKTQFPSKNRLKRRATSLGSSCCPVCILLTVFLKVFCCESLLSGNFELHSDCLVYLFFANSLLLCIRLLFFWAIDSKLKLLLILWQGSNT